MVKEEKRAGGYILCQVPRAERPYFIKNISTNIYSIEELCYYMYYNLYLLDSSIFNEELCDWIEKELKLHKLAGKLRPLMGKFTAAEDVLYPVFKEINYLTYGELKDLAVKLRRYDEEAPALRKKRMGDSLVENGMYVHAIQVYQELLKKENPETVREGLTEDIWHNLGCAYSYLFQMEKALECFRSAYEFGKSEKAKKTYLMAVRSMRTPIEYESAAAELDADEALLAEIKDEAAAFAKKPEVTVYSHNIDTMLTRFTENYHRSTGS